MPAEIIFKNPPLGAVKIIRALSLPELFVDGAVGDRDGDDGDQVLDDHDQHCVAEPETHSALKIGVTGTFCARPMIF